jgi:ABC-2 type transport system permease protein
MVAPSSGPAEAAASLGSPLGLAVRLHRGAVLWWAASALVLGLVYGSLASSIDEFLTDNESMTEIIAALGGASLTDSYLATSLLMMALMAAGPALQVVGRLRAEEADERAEPILATRVPRRIWMGSHVLVALAGSGLCMVLGGLGLGLGYAVVGGGARQVPRLFAASLAYLPALWILAGVAVLLFGVLPRWTVGGWLVLTACIVIGMFGTLLDLPTWVLDLSPLQHTPGMPAEGLRVFPISVLSAVAVGLVASGVNAFRARDIVTS